MSHKIRRALIALAAAGALVAPLAACSAGGGSDTVEINFFHRWPNEPKNSYFTELVERFEEDNPDITVNVESVLNDAYKDKVKVVAGSSNAPDVLFTWSGSFIGELVAADSLLDLGPWMAENPALAERFEKSQLPGFTVDDTLYGLPIGMHAKLFFYNRTIFAEHGLTPPTNWAEFENILRTLSAAGVTPLELGSQESWPIAHYIGTLNQRILDPAVFAEDQDPARGTFTDDGYVRALEVLLDLSASMNTDTNGIGHEDARAAWVDGDAAMMYLQGAEVGLLGDTDLDYGTFNFPAVPGGKGDPAQLTGAPEGFAISKNTKHPEEAKRFLDFLLSEENGVRYTEATGELSAVVGAVDAATAPPILAEIAGEVVGASAMTPWLDNAYDPQIVQAYLSETQLMLGGDQTPEGVMTAVRAAAERVRAQH